MTSKSGFLLLETVVALAVWGVFFGGLCVTLGFFSHHYAQDMQCDAAVTSAQNSLETVLSGGSQTDDHLRLTRRSDGLIQARYTLDSHHTIEVWTDAY